MPPRHLHACLVPLALAVGVGLAGGAGAAPAATERADAADTVVELLEHGGACTSAVVRKQELTRRCAPMLVQARYQDGHTSWLFFIEGTAEVGFHGTRDFRRRPDTHVVLVDRLRVRKDSVPAPGYCLVTGTFGHPTRLDYAGPVSIRCRAGTPEEGDLADLRFQSSGPPVRRSVPTQ